MNEIFNRIVQLINRREIRISAHGYDEIIVDNIFVRDILTSAPDAYVIEDYPDFPKGPCVLVLQKDGEGNPLHVLWGIPRGRSTPAVLITAYRPDPYLWHDDFMRRKK